MHLIGRPFNISICATLVYELRPFPRAAFGIAHDLAPELHAKIRETFTSCDFAGSRLAKKIQEYEGFTAIDYARDWVDIRATLKTSGAPCKQDNLSWLKC